MTKQTLRENRTVGAILLNMLIAAVSLFVNGFGLYLTIRANIGAAPWDVLNLGISRTFGILYGTASIAVSVRSPAPQAAESPLRISVSRVK